MPSPPSPPRRKSRLATLALAGTALALPAGAEPLVAELLAATKVTLTDNIDLEPAGNREAALVWTNSARATLRQESARTYLSADYRLDLDSIFGEERTETDLRHTLDAFARGEAVRRLVFVEAQATATQVPERTGVAPSPSDSSGNRDRVGVQTIRLSPSLTPRLGRFGAAELRYEYSRAFTASDLVAEPESHSGRAQVAFGGARHQLALLGEAETTDGRGRSADSERRTGELRLAGAVSRALTLEAMAGYEDLESDSWGEPFEGAIWTAGLTFTPGRRTKLEARAGRRYEAPFLDARLTFDPSPRTSLAAEAVRSFTAGLDTLAPPTFAIDPATGAPVALPGADGRDGFGITDQSYRFSRVALSASTRRDADRYAVSVRWEDRDYRARPDESLAEARLTWGHALSRHLTAEAGAFARLAEVEGSGTRLAGGGSLSLDWRLSERLSLTAGLGHARGEVGDNRHYHETTLTLALGWRF